MEEMEFNAILSWKIEKYKINFTPTHQNPEPKNPLMTSTWNMDEERGWQGEKLRTS